MFVAKITVIAAAGALLISGCALPVWVQPNGHPADPAAQHGTLTPITAFEQYRDAVKEMAPASPSNEPESSPGMDHHQQHDGHEEMKQ